MGEGKLEAAAMTLPTDAQLIDFVLDEAAMLDDLRFEDWLALFTEDGHYWMPLAHGQTDAPKFKLQVSVACSVSR